MALRHLVTRMRTPAAAALRSPAVSRGSPAARSQPFSATPSQEKFQDKLAELEHMFARKKYEFYRAYLQNVEHDLNTVRVFTERCERINRYMDFSFKFVLLPVSALGIALKALE